MQKWTDNENEGDISTIFFNLANCCYKFILSLFSKYNTKNWRKIWLEPYFLKVS